MDQKLIRVDFKVIIHDFIWKIPPFDGSNDKICKCFGIEMLKMNKYLIKLI